MWQMQHFLDFFRISVRHQDLHAKSSQNQKTDVRESPVYISKICVKKSLVFPWLVCYNRGGSTEPKL